MLEIVSATTSAQIESAGLRVDSVDYVSPLKANVVVSGTAVNGQRISVSLGVFIQDIDAKHFELSSFGTDGSTVIHFKSNPDYDLPLDDNGDGVTTSVCLAATAVSLKRYAMN